MTNNQNKYGKVIVLGNCATQTKDYETTNFLIDINGTVIFLDMGPGSIKQLGLAGYSPTDIDIVIVTHSHGDHSLGFPYFAFSNYINRLLGKEGPPLIPIISTEETYRGLMDMFAFCYPPGKYPNYSFKNWLVNTKGISQFEHKDIKFTICPVNHETFTFGLSITSNNFKISFSSDTLINEDFIQIAKDSDVLFHEAFGDINLADLAKKTKHSLADDAGKAAKRASVKKLVLVHPMFPYRNNPESLINEASKHFKGNIILPKELDIIPIF